jgi:phosphate transport system permease protein
MSAHLPRPLSVAATQSSAAAAHPGVDRHPLNPEELRAVLRGAGRRGSRDAHRRRSDRVATTVIWGAFLLALVPLVSVSWTVIVNGADRLNGYFLTHSMRGVFGGMDAGGIYHAIMGTLLVTGGAAVISVPIGLLTAIYLVEYGRGPLARWVTFFIDVMTGIPSIVAGLFAYALFAVFVGPGVRMGIVGSVALSVLMIPVVVRSAEEMLRLVPNELREAAYALGVPKWLTVLRVVLRTSVAGITTGVMLAVSRVIGETAPLLITVGVIDSINFNLFDGRMMTLPVYVYRQYSQGLVPCNAAADAVCIPTINYDRAWAAALTLIVIVMVLNLAGRLVTRWFAPRVVD